MVGEHIQHEHTGQRVIHNLGGAEQDGVRFNHATQNSVQFKIHIVYFWNFLFNFFGLQLTTDN